jgi:type I restriction enzyme, S subunit
MVSEWPTMTLRKANVTLIDCDHRTPPAAEAGYPYITIPQLKAGCIDLSDVRQISYEHYVEWTRKAKPSAWDVVLSRRCNPGETAVVPVDLDFALGQNLVLLHADGTKVYPPFLRWLVRGPEWWKQVGKFINVGAVFDSLKCADVPNFELRIPPLPEQHAIAHILGTLDDKIELNRRMNETLEQMARALFKSWFVDFEPVRAKAEGRWRKGESIPGLPAHLYDLFPDRFVDSELGEIPGGWEVKAIGDLADVIGGSTPSTKEPAYWSCGIHYWATPKDLSALSVPVLLDTERRVTDKGLAQISSGLLPVGTVLLSSRAPIGYLAIAEVPVAINQGFIAMKPRKGVSNLFLMLWAHSAHEEILSRANGSTFLEISKANFRPIPVVVPPPLIMERFDQLVRPLYTRLVLSERESQTLAALRDTLLPKLIAGELRVKDAERTIKVA